MVDLARSLLVEDLVVRYGDVEAVNGVSFAIAAGELLGLLGPNGAGKTSGPPRPHHARSPVRGPGLAPRARGEP